MLSSPRRPHQGGSLIALSALLLLTTPALVTAGMYGPNVVTLDSTNFDSSVLDSTATWLVKFYAPWCGHCKSSAPAFTTASTKLDGVARVGVVNCDDEKDVCSRFGVNGFPSIKVFSGFSPDARKKPDDYNGDRSAKALISHAKYVTPSDITRVKESGLEAFFRDERSLPHVLLFTDKTATSPLYKGLSAEFRGLAAFGEVRKADAGALLKTFGVDSFPSLVAFKAGVSEPEAAIRHAGGMDPKSLRAYFGGVTEGVERAPADGEKPKKKPEDKVFRQPKPFAAGVTAVVSGRGYVEECGARKDGRMCGLAFLPGGAGNKLVGGLGKVAEKFQYDNLAFAVVDTEGEDGGGKKLAEAFGVDGASGGFVAIRARKGKYSGLEEGSEVTVEAIDAFLDRLVGGDARFKKLKGELPEWEGPPGEEREKVKEEENVEVNVDGGEAKAEAKAEASARSSASAKATATSETNAEAKAEARAGSDDGESGQCGTEPPKDGEECGA